VRVDADDLEQEICVGIMQEVELDWYEPLWQGMGILGLWSLAEFIDRPFTMFSRIVEYVRLTTPEFPYDTHICYNDLGEVVAMIEKTENVAAIITGLKFFAN
jgi:hypothetical protein